LNIWTIYNWISQDLFLNRQVCLAWVQRGGNFLHKEFDEAMQDDQFVCKFVNTIGAILYLHPMPY